MRYSHLVSESYVDGPGRRAVLFLQGCPLACPGCQNKHLWPREGGREASHVDLSEQLLTANAEAITISGGEPFEQADSLEWLLNEIRKSAPNCHVIIYTGYTWQELMERALENSAILEVCLMADVIVDGRFMRDLDNGLMQYRGSANQRPIDTRATLERMGRGGGIEPVVLDWDTPEVIVTGDGALLMPIGLDLLDEPASKTRRCGQTV
ncbi:MAG TPA: 4Fe-4S single cluster domain-containing protein [Anaerolineales bacterium]|nr:4Fe-4S single cluster domain-containing protein [Anaerolineales bacterium]